jgi:hypothetical protein
MNPADLVDSEVLEICKQSPSIVIIGFTRSGKVTIAKKIAESLNIPLLISDEYLNGDNDERLYNLMDDVLHYYNNNIPFIVEGILCFRLLRKGAQLNNFFPDLVIRTECSEKTIEHFYQKEGEGHKIKRALSFNKGLVSIWDEYVELLYHNSFMKKPKLLTLNTSLPYL